MAPSLRQLNVPALRVSYDRPVDVLHITVGAPTEYEGDGLPRGIEIDYSMDDGAICGAKVIGFERNGWASEIANLARQLAGHLRVSPADLAIAIVNATNPAACGHARANWKDPKWGTSEYRGEERCEFCEALTKIEQK
jgi:uncharacterized protein YuzE